MPSAIPYNHPSLILGNIIDGKVLTVIKNISACQEKIDAAQDKLNSLMMMKRSLGMTMNELTDMNVDVKPIKTKLSEVNGKITAAATAYLATKIENEESIQKQRDELSRTQIEENHESPVDLTTGKLESRPYSSESMRLDSQYFSFGSNVRDNTMANIEKFIRSSTKSAGSVNSEGIVQQVASQVNDQVQNHSISGTLIIVANCTHRDIKVIEPLIIDPDRAVSAWNLLFGKDRINPGDLKAATIPDSPEMAAGTSHALSIITGAGYGSSFIGMVHILNSDTKESLNYDKLKPALDKKVQMGNWLANATGSFGVEKGVMEELKAFLSTQSVSCHISIITMGAVSSVKANDLKLSLKTLSEIGRNDLPNVIKYSNPKENSSFNSEAIESKNKAFLSHLHSMRIKNIMNTISEIEDRKDRVMDVSSLMTAFENYVDGIAKGSNAGIPVNFFIKKLTKPEIIKLWRNKYLSDRSTVPPAQTDKKAEKPDVKKS
jgi:hypothetical protein